MISYYRDEDGWIQLTDTPATGAWVHVEEPDEAEIEQLADEFGVPRAFLTAALDQREVARTDSIRDVHMVIVRAPYDFGADDRVPFRSVPLAMIATPENFITVCNKPIDFVRELNYSYQDEELHTHRAGRMILAILDVVGEWFLLYLEEIDKRMEDVEHRLKHSIENSEMLELLSYEKSLVYIKTGLEWNDQMVQHLQDKSHYAWDDTDKEMFADVRIEYRQGFFMAQTMLEVLEATTEAFASLISNNLNIVMKFLAAVTIVLTVPMIVASIYGMNVDLPGESYPGMYMVLMIISAALTLGVAWWFQRRGWLSFHWRRSTRPSTKDGGSDA